MFAAAEKSSPRLRAVASPAMLLAICNFAHPKLTCMPNSPAGASLRPHAACWPPRHASAYSPGAACSCRCAYTCFLHGFSAGHSRAGALTQLTTCAPWCLLLYGALIRPISLNAGLHSALRYIAPAPAIERLTPPAHGDGPRRAWPCARCFTIRICGSCRPGSSHRRRVSAACCSCLAAGGGNIRCCGTKQPHPV